MNAPRRLRPGQDIYRIIKLENVDTEERWAIFRFTYGLPSGFQVSEHESRDQARYAKKQHERKLDAMEKFKKVGVL